MKNLIEWAIRLVFRIKVTVEYGGNDYEDDRSENR